MTLMRLSKSGLALALLLALWPASAASAAATIAVMPFDYTAKVKTRTKFTRTGPRGRTWVIKTSDQFVIEFETHEFTNKLISSLVKENKFTVVERKKLDRLFDEQKLGQAGLADAATAAKMGKLLGADYFIMADISVYEARAQYQYFKVIDRYKRKVSFDIVVDVRVVDTSKGKIVFADKVETHKKFESKVSQRVGGKLSRKTVDEVQRDLCGKLVRKIVDSVFPVKVIKYSRGVAYLNRGKSGGLSAGQTFKVVEQGEELVDEDTGLVLGAEEADVAIIQVTEALAKFSKAKVVKWLVSGQSKIAKGAICRPFSGKVPETPKPPADTTAPTVKFLSPKANVSLNVNPVNVWIESPDKDVARVVIQGQEATNKGNGRWAVKITAKEGQNTIVAKAYDQAGNVGSAQLSFNFDSTPPEVSASAEVVVKGKVDDPQSTVTINGKPVTVKADGSYEAKVKLSGSRKVVIIATDPFGNTKRIEKNY